MKFRRIVGVMIGLLVAAGGIGLAAVLLARPGLEAYAQHRYAAPPRPGALTATWFGTTAVLLSDGQTSLFVDPFFTRPEGLINLLRNATIAPDEALIRQWLVRAHVDHLDAVLVSHSHFDHAMDAAVVARLTGAPLVGSASTANIGLGGGLPADRVDTVGSGDVLRLGAFRVTFIKSRHAGATGGAPTGDITRPLTPPARYFDYRQGGTYSILIEHRDGTLLHHGSAGFVPGALAGRHADVVFLGVALVPDLAQYLAQVVDAVGATRVIPVHWDDFTRSLSRPLVPMPVVVNLPKFFSGMAALRPGVKVQTLELGQPVALFAGS